MMSSQSLTMAIEGSEGSPSISQLFNLGNKIYVLQLSDDNFLLWKFQVITALGGYDLEIFF